MNLRRLSIGERISSISAILLFGLTFFHWYGVKAVNISHLLFQVESVASGKSAWEALDFIPIVLMITIVVTLAVAAMRLIDAPRKSPGPINALVVILGIVSALLILYRIVDPPVFYEEPTITDEGTAQLPIFLALLAAAGIAFGGLWAIRERGIGISSRAIPLVILLMILVIPAQAVASWEPRSDHGRFGKYCNETDADVRGEWIKGQDGPVTLGILAEGLHVRMSVRYPVYHRGATVYARVENIGTEAMFDPREYTVERWSRVGWLRVGPKQRGEPLAPLPMLAGGHGRCFSFGVPERAKVGRYRVMKWIEYGVHTSGERSSIEIAHEFRVRA